LSLLAELRVLTHGAEENWLSLLGFLLEAGKGRSEINGLW